MYQQDPYAQGGGGGPFLFMLALVVGSAVAVYIDAKRIGARKGLVDGIANNSPGVWAFGVVALWILVLPIYLVSRGKIRTAANAEKTSGYGSGRPVAGVQQHGWGAGVPAAGFGAHATPQPVLPPAGWYEDPQDRACNRWWDGRRWTEHRTPKPN